jgi:hypothetical protein
MNKLVNIFKENWFKIILSYLLFSINTLLTLTYPKVLGNTIDHLMNKEYLYIWYLVFIFLAMMLFGYISRVYDVKVFSTIYKNFASNEVNKQLEKGIESSKINGRLNMLNSIVHFFEYDMINVLGTVFGVLGSLYFLSLVSIKIVYLLILTGSIIIALSYFFSPKFAYLTKLNNDLSEQQSDIIISRKITLIDNFLLKSQKISISQSKLYSKYNVTIQSIVYFSVTTLLTYYVMFNKVTIGSVFSTYRYMFDFCNSLIGVPFIVTSYLQIKDVINRLEE